MNQYVVVLDPANPDTTRVVTLDYRCPVCGHFGFPSTYKNACTACANKQREADGTLVKLSPGTADATARQ